MTDAESDVKRRINNSLIDSMANVFALACRRHYDLHVFTKLFLNSDTYNDFYDDFSLNCQSVNYVLNRFMSELGVELPKSETDETEAGYWVGWILGHWQFDKGLSGRDILKGYDIDYIIDSYPCYHTQGNRYVYYQFEREGRLDKSSDMPI